MPIRAIAYMSQAANGLSLDAINDLVDGAAIFNASAGVTGMLLFDGFRFMQYIEGPEDGVSVVYSRILNSKSHTDLVELGRGRAGRRNFPYWAMRLLPSEPDELKFVARNDWSVFIIRPTTGPGRLYGVEALAKVVVPHLAHPL